MPVNPLQGYFKQPSLYIKLPSQNFWYGDDDIKFDNDGELAIYPMSAIDEIMINTPDAILNGTTLENIVKNCVPGIINAKKIVIPDLEAIFLAIKKASTNKNGIYEFEEKCPKCNAENSFDINLTVLIDSMTSIELSDSIITLDDNLIIYVKPYTLEMRQLYTKKEIEEQRLIKQLDIQNQNIDDIDKAKIISDSINRITQMTFELVAQSIIKIEIIVNKEIVTDQSFINEWLSSISKTQADQIINTVVALNSTGVNKKLNAICSECNHTWKTELELDPTSFFGRR
jgi:hypothetical protein